MRYTVFGDKFGNQTYEQKLSQPHIIIVLYMPHEISRTSALRTYVSPHIIIIPWIVAFVGHAVGFPTPFPMRKS